ncbi:hypothetical protein D9B85_14435 [Corynebacterium diphtheriae]|nr:hypothetical protein D9B85_14435 [Corynebacterium diphtheriae]
MHRARDRQGRALIMKVQYPGIHAICEADLRQLRRLMPLGRLFGTPPARLEAVYTELHWKPTCSGCMTAASTTCSNPSNRRLPRPLRWARCIAPAIARAGR